MKQEYYCKKYVPQFSIRPIWKIHRYWYDQAIAFWVESHVESRTAVLTIPNRSLCRKVYWKKFRDNFEIDAPHRKCKIFACLRRYWLLVVVLNGTKRKLPLYIIDRYWGKVTNWKMKFKPNFLNALFSPFTEFQIFKSNYTINTEITIEALGSW